MTPTKENIQMWVDALRSGKYSQTTEHLQDEKGYCCLGVLCDITIPASKSIMTVSGKFLEGNLPWNQPSAPEWVKTISNEFCLTTREEIASLNDLMGLTFDEIADCLEAVYILEVLK